MLLPDAVIPFLQHDDPIVRHHARRYFEKASDVGSLTADHYWAAMDRLELPEEKIPFAADLSALRQTDQSIDRLLAELQSKPSEKYEYHLQRAAGTVDEATLRRRAAEMLQCPVLFPNVRQRLERRLLNLDLPPLKAWEQLMMRGKQLAGKYVGDFDETETTDLCEAAARDSSVVAPLARAMLDDESEMGDWREVFAIEVLGCCRDEASIPMLVQRFGIDSDDREWIHRALARIGTTEVVEEIVAFYPGQPWHARLYAHGPLANIKRLEAEAGLLKLIEIEEAGDVAQDDDEAEPLTDQLIIGLTELGSLSGLDAARKLLREELDDPELLYLAECLLATATMAGIRLEEEPRWRAAMDQRDRRAPGSIDELMEAAKKLIEKSKASRSDNTTGESMRDYLREHDMLHEDELLADELFSPREVTKPFRNVAEKVGRNDPCPCGSGAKYKKCCMR